MFVIITKILRLISSDLITTKHADKMILKLLIALEGGVACSEAKNRAYSERLRLVSYTRTY